MFDTTLLQKILLLSGTKRYKNTVEEKKTTKYSIFEELKY